MKNSLLIVFLFLGFGTFAQNKTPLSQELQNQKTIELDAITDEMSFARKERYLDSLQTAGIIIRKTEKRNSKGCTLEDREVVFGKPQEEIIIFLEK